MEKSKLVELIAMGKTQREISLEYQTSQTNVRYWLKKYKLVTMNREGRKRFKPHCCKKCGETNPNNFYGGFREVCKKCHNNRAKKEGKEKRAYAVNKLGGKCINPECGYDKYICSLDIHHTDPSKKDENFKSMRGWSKERIDKEIIGCVILCRNCHAAFHNGFLQI